VTLRWCVVNELLLAPEINPRLPTDAFLIDRHFFQTSKSSKQKLEGRWHGSQVLLVPVLKHLEAGNGLIVDFAINWEAAKLVQIS